jgi:hypothetical protein
MNLWDTPNMPHKGWICIGMVDLGEFVEPGDIEYERCEMCGKEKIRYVHIMKHESYGTVRVGRVCASKMEDDYKNPEQRDDECKNRAARRSNFLKRDWNRRSNGNYTLRYKGDNITIVKSKFGPGYGVVFKGKYIWEYKGRKQMDFNTAKRAAFDLFDSLHEPKTAPTLYWDGEDWII